MRKKPLVGIYLIRNKVNNHVYVGKSVNLVRRRKAHWSELRNNKHYNAKLQAAWRKYGEQSFVFEIVVICESKEDLESLENAFLSEAEYSYYNIQLISGAPYSRKHSTRTRKILAGNKARDFDAFEMFLAKLEHETDKKLPLRRIN